MITINNVAKTSTKPGQILVLSASLFLKDLLVINPLTFPYISLLECVEQVLNG